MTKSDVYFISEKIGKSRQYQGPPSDASGRLAIEYGENSLHKLITIIDNTDYPNQVKYVKFLEDLGAVTIDNEGLICLETGVLYYVTYKSPLGLVLSKYHTVRLMYAWLIYYMRFRRYIGLITMIQIF